MHQDQICPHCAHRYKPESPKARLFPATCTKAHSVTPWATLSLSLNQSRMSSPAEITAGMREHPEDAWIWLEILSGSHKTCHHLIDAERKSQGLHTGATHLLSEVKSAASAHLSCMLRLSAYLCHLACINRERVFKQHSMQSDANTCHRGQLLFPSKICRNNQKVLVFLVVASVQAATAMTVTKAFSCSNSRVPHIIQSAVKTLCC